MKSKLLDIFSQTIAYTITILLFPCLIFVGLWWMIEEWRVLRKAARPD